MIETYVVGREKSVIGEEEEDTLILENILLSNTSEAVHEQSVSPNSRQIGQLGYYWNYYCCCILRLCPHHQSPRSRCR